MWSIWFCREVFGFVVRYFVFAVRFSVLPWGILFLPWGFLFCREVFGFAVTVVGHRITYSGPCPWLQRMRLSVECSPEIFSAVWLTLELYDYPKRGISYIACCIASYYIIKLPHARDPISSTTVECENESDLFCRYNFLYLCCVDLFTIFVLLYQIYLLLSQRECFGGRLWVTLR